MNMEELVTKIVKDLNTQGIQITKKIVKAVYNSIIESLYEEAVNEENMDENGKIKIRLPKLGSFNISKQDPYMGVNPKTKTKIPIEEFYRIYFAASQTFKDKVQQRKNK